MTATTLSIPDGMLACRQWYAGPHGQNTLERVQTIVAHLTTDIFGYYALEMGALAGKHRLLQDSRIASQFTVGAVLGEANHLLAMPEQLPIAFNNVDLVIASHVLDCTKHPHQVLREIERVLVPEGHCILIGFNPFSWCGLRQRLPWRNKPATPYHSYSTFRVRDWLSVLGFEVLTTVSAHRLPNNKLGNLVIGQSWGRWREQTHLTLGSVYIIHAQKKVSNMTPLLSSRKSINVLRPKIIVNSGAGRVTEQERQHADCE